MKTKREGGFGIEQESTEVTVPSTKSQRAVERAVIKGLTPLEQVTDYLDRRPPSQKKEAEQEAILHRRFWRHLPEEHEISRMLQSMTDDILKMQGLPPGFLRLTIYDGVQPSVEVQLLARELRVSSAFLNVVQGDRQKLQAVIGHEIGHLTLAHYRGAQSGNFDPLSEHVRSYEEEYQADQFSGILLNRLGLRPSVLAETLTELENSIKKGIEAHDAENTRQGRLSPIELAWIFSTHPQPARRATALQRLDRILPKYPQQKLSQTQRIRQPSEADWAPLEWTDWMQKLSDDRFAWSSWIRYYSIIKGKSPYPDCFWEEIPQPEELFGLIQEKLRKKEKIIKGEPKTIIQIAPAPKRPAPPLEHTPEQIAHWTAEHSNEMEHWWDQALSTIDSTDGYDDLSAEIRQYPLPVVRMLLETVKPEFVVLNDNHSVGYSEIDADSRKCAAIDEILYDRAGYHANVERMIVASLLVRTLFEQDPTVQTIEGFEQLGEYLRTYYKKHGVYLPYTGARWLHHLEQLYSATSDPAIQNRILRYGKEYEQELTAGVTAGVVLARRLMPTLCAALDQQFPSEIFREERTLIEWRRKKTELGPKVEAILDQKTISAEDARRALELIPENYRPKNITLEIQAFLDDKKEQIEEYRDVTPNWVLDLRLQSDPTYAATQMSTNAFEEAFFGSGREKYVKARYGAMDEMVEDFSAIERLWNASGYAKELEALPPGQPKIDFLLQHYPALSATRDTALAHCAGFGQLKFVEDIEGLQERISGEKNVAYLFALLNGFSNPLLLAAASQRLWAIAQEDRNAFLQAAPEQQQASAKETLEQLPEHVRTRQLETILLCFPQPSYLRDELLRPLVDAAPDQLSTLALASLYSEPPPGTIRPRTVEIVGIGETLRDALERMPTRDAQEAILYIFGHRFFYSTIDTVFFPELKRSAEQYRSDALFLGEEEFFERYRVTWGSRGLKKLAKTPENENLKGMHLVDIPDSLVRLVKSTGIPLRLLKEQHRLFSTAREQIEFITALLEKNDAFALKEKERFFTAIAHAIVDGSHWAKDRPQGEQHLIKDLLAFSLVHCPTERLPSLFLSVWKLKQESHELPKVVATMIRQLGSLFVKAGQYLATQTATLPLEWTEAFRSLSDQNTRAEKTLAYEFEHAYYGDASPLKRLGAKQGEGSMAAVYEGDLNDGTRVAIKLFHPRIEEQLKDDVEFLDHLAQFINQRKEFSVRLPTNLAKVSQKHILAELSFDRILENNATISDVLQRSEAAVPMRTMRVLPEHSRPGCIISEFSPGRPIDEWPASVQSLIRGEIGAELFRQVLLEGAYQGDPNIGNFKVRPEKSSDAPEQIDWIDTDHVGRLLGQDAQHLRTFIKSLVFSRDAQSVAGVLTSLLEATSDDAPKNIPTALEQWMKQTNILATAPSIESVEMILTSLLDFLYEKRIVLKEPYVTLLRTLGLMKPYMRDLQPEKLLPLFVALQSMK